MVAQQRDVGLLVRGAAALAVSAAVLASLVATPSSAEAAAALPAPTCGVFAAHRGEHSHYTENSIGSLRAAATLGADWVDIDVRQSKDSALVLMHDATVDRTTTGTGSVYSKTAAQLYAIKLNDGTRVTNLGADLAAIKDSKVKLMIEIKSLTTTLAWTRMRDRMREYGAARVVVTSFNQAYLDRFRSYAPEIPTSLITSSSQPSPAAVAVNGSIDIAHRLVTDEWAADVRAQGYPIYAWTPNTTTDWTRLTGKVDVISTDAAKAFVAWRATACAT